MFDGQADPVPLQARRALDVSHTQDDVADPAEPADGHHGAAGSSVRTAAGKRSQVSA